MTHLLKVLFLYLNIYWMFYICIFLLHIFRCKLNLSDFKTHLFRVGRVERKNPVACYSSSVKVSDIWMEKDAHVLQCLYVEQDSIPGILVTIRAQWNIPGYFPVFLFTNSNVHFNNKYVIIILWKRKYIFCFLWFFFRYLKRVFSYLNRN